MSAAPAWRRAATRAPILLPGVQKRAGAAERRDRMFEKAASAAFLKKANKRKEETL